jgi:hypothetical protein
LPFDAAQFKAKRRREVTLSDGIVCSLRKPNLMRVAMADDLPAISEKLAHELTELGPLAQSMSAPELKARAQMNASYGDIYNYSLAVICDAVVGPMRFVMDRDKEDVNADPPRIWADELDANDVETLLLAAYDMLGLNKEGGDLVAPFCVPDAAGASGAGAASEAPQQPTQTSSPPTARLAVSYHVGELAGVRDGCSGDESGADAATQSAAECWDARGGRLA